MLHELLAEPFGPYPDSLILSTKCKSTAKGMVSLSSLCLESNDAPIGLDRSEVYHQTATHPIRFYGILEVKSLSWLSPRGQEWLESDLHERDLEKRMHPEKNPVSKLTLKGLYGTRGGGGLAAGEIFGEGRTSKLWLKVWIQGERNMSVSFLISDLVPSGLLLTSKDHNRQYEVLSMHVETHRLSHNFFARYRLLALMEDIVKTDNNRTPIEERNIDYFVDHYIERYAFTNRHRHHRDIFDSDDSDVDEHGKTEIPRRPRHLPRSEVIGRFAAHSEWILADQLAKRDKKVVDIVSWEAFCHQVRRARRDARNSGLLWGLPDGKPNEEDFSDNLDLRRYPMFGKDLLKLLKAERKRRIPRADRGSSSEDELMDSPQDPVEQNVYDPDFSELSTPSASDPDADADPPPDPELVALVPSCFWQPPVLPVAGFIWHCPVHPCRHMIDMLKLTDEDVTGLHMRDVTFLRGKKWTSLRDAQVVKSFYWMVSKHWKDHLKNNGIRVRQSNAKCTLEWIHPGQHRTWPLPKPKIDD